MHISHSHTYMNIYRTNAGARAHCLVHFFGPAIAWRVRICHRSTFTSFGSRIFMAILTIISKRLPCSSLSNDVVFRLNSTICNQFQWYNIIVYCWVCMTYDNICKLYSRIRLADNEYKHSIRLNRTHASVAVHYPI